MENVLITGASGFVGSFLVEEAIKRNLKPIAAIRQSSSKQYLNHPSIDFIYLNLYDKNDIKQKIKEYINQNGPINYIIHNAGVTKVTKHNEFMQVNFQCTKNFVEAISELNIAQLKKFIHISSLAAIGPGNNQTLEPIKLNDIPHPNTEYGLSKLKGEIEVRNHIELPWLIFRPTGIYGPREKDYFVFLKTIHKGFEPYIGFKTQYLTFIYVKDLVRLIFDALNTPIIHKAYFVSDGNVYTSEEYAHIVKKALNKKTLKIRIPLTVVKIIAYTIDFIFSLFW